MPTDHGIHIRAEGLRRDQTQARLHDARRRQVDDTAQVGDPPERFQLARCSYHRPIRDRIRHVSNEAMHPPKIVAAPTCAPGGTLLRNVSIGYEHELRPGGPERRVRKGLIDLDGIGDERE